MFFDHGQIIDNTAGGDGGGIETFSEEFDGVGLTVTGNVAGGSGGALWAGGSFSPSILFSCIVFNSDTAVEETGGIIVDARFNWWGSPDGPSGAGPGSGDSVSANVDFSGFTTSAIRGCPSYTAHLTLVKQVTNDTGGTAAATDWTLAASGPTPISGPGGVDSDVDVGTYTLSESGGPSGYTASAWSCVGGSQAGNRITLARDESATCTISNDDDAVSLLLQKTVMNNNGGTAMASEWTLFADAFSVTGSAAPVEVTDQADTYDLTESVVAGYTLTSLTCDDDPDTEVTSVTIGLGETITCTFVNDDDVPKLTPVKVVENGDNPGGASMADDWTLAASGPTGFSGRTGVTSDASFDQGWTAIRSWNFNLSGEGVSESDSSPAAGTASRTRSSPWSQG